MLDIFCLIYRLYKIDTQRRFPAALPLFKGIQASPNAGPIRWQTKGSPDYLCIWFKVTVCLYCRSAFPFSFFEILLDWDVT